MTIGLVGRKCGMTRVFTDAGVTVPVTVVEALPNRISQVKSDKTDGYRAVQITIGARRPSRVSKALAGHFAKANVAAGYTSEEFRLGKGEGEALAAGGELKVDMFTVGQIVDVTGTTVGKGFQGTMKRHNFAGGMKTHGNSVSHRAPGSIGQRQTPGRVFKGKRMSGHMGVRNRTIENLRIVEVDVPRNLLLISGAVPGSEGGRVIVKPSVKAAGQARRQKLMPNKAPVAAKGASAAKGAAPAKAAQEVNPHEAPAKERISRQRNPIVGCGFRPRLQRSAGAPGRHRLSGGRTGRHQGAESRAPKSAAAARSPGARKARARPAPARFAAPSGWAAAGPSPPGRAISRKRSIARCIARPCNPWCRSWFARIACSPWNRLELTAPKTKLLISKLAEFGLTRALILVEAYEEKLFLAARNVPYVDVMPVASLDPLSLIKHDKVIATVGALKLLEQRLGGANE